MRSNGAAQGAEKNRESQQSQHGGDIVRERPAPRDSRLGGPRAVSASRRYNEPVREFVRLIEEPRVCSYLPEQSASLEYRIIQGLRPHEYEDLLARGYRRFGRQLFRPQCAGCRQCVSVRVLVQEHRPTASQRRVLRRNASIRAVQEPVYVTDRHVQLYNRYHAFMAGRRGWRKDAIGRGDYYESFVAGGGDFASQWLYYDGAKLVGVALMDETPQSVSLVYYFHDPEWRHDSPGTFSVLTQLEHARRAGKTWAYPGYWIPANQSMAYKARFRPFERLSAQPPDFEDPQWIRHSDASEDRAAPAERAPSGQSRLILVQ